MSCGKPLGGILYEYLVPGSDLRHAIVDVDGAAYSQREFIVGYGPRMRLR